MDGEFHSGWDLITFLSQTANQNINSDMCMQRKVDLFLETTKSMKKFESVAENINRQNSHRK